VTVALTVQIPVTVDLTVQIPVTVDLTVQIPVCDAFGSQDVWRLPLPSLVVEMTGSAVGLQLSKEDR
jgi:hypothetical protein